MSTTNYKTKLSQAEKLVAVELGKVKLPVTSVSQPFQKEGLIGKEGYRHSILVNFAAYEPRNKQRIMDAFQNGELEEADISGMTFTHEIIVSDRNPNPVLPIKGDIIEANVAFAMKDGEYVLGKIDGKQIMNVTTFSVPVAKELKSGLFSKKAEISDKPGIAQTEATTEAEAETSAF